MNPQETAAALSERGYVVHAVRGKVPTRREWQKATTSDPAALTGHPPGIGIVTGRASARGLLVVDTDIDETKNGEASLVELYERHAAGIPPEPIAQTGGGGYHRWYRIADGAPTPPNSAGLLGIGIDVRCAGGQVVVPPSPHASGRPYRWTNGIPPRLVDLPEAPAWLLALLTNHETNTDAGSANTGKILEGKRNDALTRALGSWLARQPTLPDRADAESYARRWNREHCSPPMDGDRAKNTARSILKRETNKRQEQGRGEFEPPEDPDDMQSVFERVFHIAPGLELQDWERHHVAPAPTKFRLRTNEGPVELTTLSRYPTARDEFSRVGLRIKAEYARQLAWQEASEWLRRCTTAVDLVEEDGEGVADWIASWIGNARWFAPPQLELHEPDEVAISPNDLIAHLDRHRRVGRWSDAEVRVRLRDAGFERRRGYWLKRAAYVINDAEFYAVVTDAMNEFRRRASEDPSNPASRGDHRP